MVGEEGGDPGTRSAIERCHTGDFAVVGECSRGQGLVPSIGVVNRRITIASDATLHLQARKRALNAGGAPDGGNCVDKLAVRILPALQLERECAVFKTHPLVPPGSCAIKSFASTAGPIRSSSRGGAMRT